VAVGPILVEEKPELDCETEDTCEAALVDKEMDHELEPMIDDVVPDVTEPELDAGSVLLVEVAALDEAEVDDAVLGSEELGIDRVELREPVLDATLVLLAEMDTVAVEKSELTVDAYDELDNDACELVSPELVDFTVDLRLDDSPLAEMLPAEIELDEEIPTEGVE